MIAAVSALGIVTVVIITVLVYTDRRCPFCGRKFDTTDSMVHHAVNTHFDA